MMMDEFFRSCMAGCVNWSTPEASSGTWTGVTRSFSISRSRARAFERVSLSTGAACCCFDFSFWGRFEAVRLGGRDLESRFERGLERGLRSSNVKLCDRHFGGLVAKARRCRCGRRCAHFAAASIFLKGYMSKQTKVDGSFKYVVSL